MIHRLTPYPMRRCPVKWTINLRPDGLDSLSWGADTRVDSKMLTCSSSPSPSLGTSCFTLIRDFWDVQHQLAPVAHLFHLNTSSLFCISLSLFHLFHLNTSFILCKTNFIFRHLSCSTFHFHFWNLKPSLLRFTFVFSSKHFLPTLLFKKEIFMHLSFPFTFEFNTSASVFHFHFFHWNICSRFLHYIYLNTSFPLCLSLSLFISPRPPLPLTFTF